VLLLSQGVHPASHKVRVCVGPVLGVVETLPTRLVFLTEVRNVWQEGRRCLRARTGNQQQKALLKEESGE